MKWQGAENEKKTRENKEAQEEQATSGAKVGLERKTEKWTKWSGR